MERNAALIMTYFRPFTLNPEWNTEDVPFLGQMCGQADSWHSSMQYWFDGHILSEESKRYIQNFLVVTRVRPDEENVDHSDDLLSDEELIVDNSSFLEAISTRVGPRKKLPTIDLINTISTGMCCCDRQKRMRPMTTLLTLSKKLRNIGRCRRCPQIQKGLQVMI